MEYKEKSLTREGASLFAQAAADKTKEFTLDKLVVSPTVIPAGTDISALTLDDFKDAVQFDVNNVTQTDNSFTATGVISNEGMTDSLSIALIGLLGHVGEDTSNSGIVAVAVGNDPFILPEDNGTPFRIVPALTIGFSYSDKVTLVVNDDVFVTQSNLKSVISAQGFINEESLEKFLVDHKIATEAYVNDQVKAIKPAAGTMTLSDDNVSVKATTKDGEQTGVFVTQAMWDDMTKSIADAKQAAIDQSHSDAEALLKAAGLGKLVHLTQAEFDALTTKDPDAYYFIDEGA